MDVLIYLENQAKNEIKLLFEKCLEVYWNAMETDSVLY